MENKYQNKWEIGTPKIVTDQPFNLVINFQKLNITPIDAQDLNVNMYICSCHLFELDCALALGSDLESKGIARIWTQASQKLILQQTKWPLTKWLTYPG